MTDFVSSIQIVEDLPEEPRKRTPGERERDLEYVSSLYLRGKKPTEIMDALAKQYNYQGLTTKHIESDLKELRQMWVKSALINYDQAKAREIAHIDELESEAWVAWNKSWGKAFTVVSEDISDAFGHKDDEPEEVSKKPSTYNRKRETSTAKDLLGDPRYLDTIKWCIEQRCKILGLHEPMRLAITWKDEATKAGISADDAEVIYKKMVSEMTGVLRDKYIKENTVIQGTSKDVEEESYDPSEA